MLVALYGKVEAGDRGGHRFQIMQPQFEILHDPTESRERHGEEQKWQSLEVGRIVPIYEAAGNGRLTARWFRRVIHGMLENLDQDIPDAIPASVRGRMELDRSPPRFLAGALARGWREPDEACKRRARLRTFASSSRSCSSSNLGLN